MMNRKYLLGVAAAALLTAGGAAQAADVLPIIVTPVPEVAVTDPLTIDIEAGIAGWFEPADSEREIWAYLEGEITYVTPTGWGVDLNFEGGTGLNYPGFDAEATLEVYKSLGALSLGLLVGAEDDSEYFFGPTLGYDVGALELDAGLFFNYEGGGIYDGANLDLAAEYEFSDRLAVGAAATLYFYNGYDGYEAFVEGAFGVTETITLYAAAAFDPGDAEYGLGVDIELGAFTPYALATFGQGDTEWYIGVDFEHQFGTGPFGIVAGAEVELEQGNNPEFTAYVGFTFTRGDTDDGALGFFGDYLPGS